MASERDVDEQERDEDYLTDEMSENDPLLPIFSSAHLDVLPVFHLTRNIRLIIAQKCDTTLSWDQLRSPQISQYLVKPMQNKIRTLHFNRATLYALLANCLQFKKEAKLYPGDFGVLTTRAIVSELLAIRFLKDFNMRELIDGLSYDFDPTCGAYKPETEQTSPKITSQNVARARLARTSCLEVAIRAQAKRFLSHPVVVQHLEAVWAGFIVFHFAADNFHRVLPHDTRTDAPNGDAAPSSSQYDQCCSEPVSNQAVITSVMYPCRRSVTLYDPAKASLFKLSRLRVPRYRQVFSLISYSILLGLFVAVLAQNEIDITALEITFWFWSAGYMLSEIVDFSEQGFSLFLASVWNVLDVGILLLFLLYYCLRLYGVTFAKGSERQITIWAHEILGSTAVLLFPRLFSFLDHYKYFSQLLIAFKLMASDLFAVLILIAISCSGFFVALSLSFAKELLDANSVAYSLFQILMGFTPAAWSVWSEFDPLGKVVLTLLLVVAHFLIVTILISVLTNSFMTITKNANEEHQFLFAINTISMVKSDALFSYIAPCNLLGWAITPLRHIMPFHHFIRLNRTLIKLTHLPILFLIFVYEKWPLAPYASEPLELVKRAGRHNDPSAEQGKTNLYMTHNRLRETSMATFRKDQALEKVFRSPVIGESMTHNDDQDSEHDSNVVDQWICGLGYDAEHSQPPWESNSSFDQSLSAQSNESSPKMDPRNVLSRSLLPGASPLRTDPRSTTFEQALVTRDSTGHENGSTHSDMNDALISDNHDLNIKSNEQDGDFSTVQEELGSDKENIVVGAKNTSCRKPKVLARPKSTFAPYNSRTARHMRSSSTATILFNPLSTLHSSTRTPRQYHHDARPVTAIRRRTRQTETVDQRYLNRFTKEKRTVQDRDRKVPDSILKPGDRPLDFNQSTFALTGRRRAAELASDIGDNKYAADTGIDFALGTSFDSHSPWLRNINRQKKAEKAARTERLMLARMDSIEEGFRNILNEVREWRNTGSFTTNPSERVSDGK